MRDYGKVHASFWTSSDIRELSEDGRSMALYLLTCPHGTIAGVFRLPDGYVCDDMQWSCERVNQTLSELLAKGFATRCMETKWVWVRKHLVWNPPENPNQKKSALKVALQVPSSCSWAVDFIETCGEQLGLAPVRKEPLPNPLTTLPQPVSIAVTETIPETVVVPPTAPKVADIPPGFDRFWNAWPSNDRKQAKGKCLDAWKKAGAERFAETVLTHVESLKNSAWLRDNGQFVPAPLVYLNQRRWEGAALESTQPSAWAGAI